VLRLKIRERFLMRKMTRGLTPRLGCKASPSLLLQPGSDVSRFSTSFGSLMYRNKTSLSVIGPVVPALMTASNMTKVYVFWVNGLNFHGTRKIWGLFGPIRVSSWLAFGGCVGSQCLTLFGVSELTYLLHMLCLGPCRCMFGVLEPFSEMSMVFNG
jgi:hypothetical protein